MLIFLIFQAKIVLLGCKDGSVIKSTYALAEDLGWIPSSHMVTRSQLSLTLVLGETRSSSDFPGDQAHMWATYIQADRTLIHTK